MFFLSCDRKVHAWVTNSPFTSSSISKTIHQSQNPFIFSRTTSYRVSGECYKRGEICRGRGVWPPCCWLLLQFYPEFQVTSSLCGCLWLIRMLFPEFRIFPWSLFHSLCKICLKGAYFATCSAGKIVKALSRTNLEIWVDAETLKTCIFRGLYISGPKCIFSRMFPSGAFNPVFNLRNQPLHANPDQLVLDTHLVKEISLFTRYLCI